MVATLPCELLASVLMAGVTTLSFLHTIFCGLSSYSHSAAGGLSLRGSAASATPPGIAMSSCMLGRLVEEQQLQ
jgi:hypothetical protein